MKTTQELNLILNFVINNNNKNESSLIEVSHLGLH
jgi:hypothetical protein